MQVSALLTPSGDRHSDLACRSLLDLYSCGEAPLFKQENSAVTSPAEYQDKLLISLIDLLPHMPCVAVFSPISLFICHYQRN